MATKEKYDGRSRPTNSLYEQRWNEIFKSNPVAKDCLLYTSPSPRD